MIPIYESKTTSTSTYFSTGVSKLLKKSIDY